jgi:hypothetical protein
MREDQPFAWNMPSVGRGSHFLLLSSLNGDFLVFSFLYDIHPGFICRPSDSTVSEDAGIEPRIVATGALAVRRSNH